MKASPETGLLLTCSSSALDEERLSTAVEALAEEVDWAALLAAAEREGVLPLLARHLGSKDLAPLVPGEVKEKLSAHDEKNRRFCLFLFQETVGIVSRLGDEGITAVPFKGPVMADTLYRDAGARPAGDIDVIVARKDVSRARRILTGAGYVPHLPVRPGRESAYVDHYYAWTLVGPANHAVIDLHWELARAYCPAVLAALPWRERLSCQVAGGREVPVFAVEDTILLLTIHGGWHRWKKLLWICDVAEVLKGDVAVDWNLLFSEAERLGMSAALDLGLLLARDLLAAPLPDTAVARVAGNGSAAALAAEVKGDFEGGRRGRGGRLARKTGFHLHLIDSRRGRAAFLLGWILRPNLNDWLWVSLPEPLAPLYGLVRPVRLALHAFSAPLRRRPS